MKQKLSHRNRDETCGCQGKEARGGNGVGGWVQQMCTFIDKMNKQQDPTVQHRKQYLVFYDKPKWKKI